MFTTHPGPHRPAARSAVDHSPRPSPLRVRVRSAGAARASPASTAGEGGAPPKNRMFSRLSAGSRVSPRSRRAAHGSGGWSSSATPPPPPTWHTTSSASSSGHASTPPSTELSGVAPAGRTSDRRPSAALRSARHPPLPAAAPGAAASTRRDRRLGPARAPRAWQVGEASLTSPWISGPVLGRAAAGGRRARRHPHGLQHPRRGAPPATPSARTLRRPTLAHTPAVRRFAMAAASRRGARSDRKYTETVQDGGRCWEAGLEGAGCVESMRPGRQCRASETRTTHTPQPSSDPPSQAPHPHDPGYCLQLARPCHVQPV